MEIKIENIVKVMQFYISAVVGFIIGLLGETTPTFRLLKFLIVVDFLTGLSRALIEKNINSRKIFLGGYKKGLIFLVIMIANQLDIVFTDLYLRETTIIYYIINEGVSILENISTYIPIPNEIGQFFTDIKESEEDENK